MAHRISRTTTRLAAYFFQKEFICSLPSSTTEGNVSHITSSFLHSLHQETPSGKYRTFEFFFFFFAVHDSIFSSWNVLLFPAFLSYKFILIFSLVTNPVPISCFLHTVPPESHLELSQLYLAGKSESLQATGRGVCSFLSLLWPLPPGYNQSPRLIPSALQESETNIWNLFARNKISDSFSGVLACTCTSKSPPRRQVLKKCNQE